MVRGRRKDHCKQQYGPDIVTVLSPSSLPLSCYSSSQLYFIIKFTLLKCLSIFTELWNNCHLLFLKFFQFLNFIDVQLICTSPFSNCGMFYLSYKRPCTHQQPPPHSFYLPSPSQPLIYFLPLQICLFGVFHINVITQCIAFLGEESGFLA